MQMGLARRRTGWIVVLLSVAACTRGRQGSTTNPPAAPVAAAPLAGLSVQVLLVTPTQRARVATTLTAFQAPAPTELIKSMDADLTTALREREIGRTWVFGDALARSHATNPTYATDPRALAVDPLRAPSLQRGGRLAEPLASQLRTMIALHNGRMVLIPVDLAIEPEAGATGGRGVLRLVLVDPRLSVIQWYQDIRGDTAPTYGPAVTASIASRIANLFAAQ
jgi:hypothetical protein